MAKRDKKNKDRNMATDNAATDPSALELELKELIGARGVGSSWGDSMVGWCTKSLIHLIRADPDSPERRILSVWGTGVVRMLLVGLMDRNEVLPPVFCRWLQDNILPAIFDDSAGDGIIVTKHPDVAQLLLRCLLQTASVVQAAVVVEGGAVAKRKAGKKRARKM